jgi:RND family efflux transporter MFP subunit
MNTFTPYLLFISMLFSLAISAQQPPARSVKVDEVRQTIFTPTVDIVGAIYSRNNVQLTAGTNGRLDWVAEPGSFLLKGDDVAHIDPQPLKLQQAEQQVTIRRAKINQQYLKRELARLAELRQTNNASVFQFDQTKSQYELAGADLEIAQLKLQQIQDQLNRTVIKAPFEGVITERMREAGGEVSRSDVLVQMLDTENLEGRIFVPIKYLPFIRQTKEVMISGADNSLVASIKSIIPSADMRSQSFELRVTLPKEANSIWAAGQHIKASLPVQNAQQMLTVHRDALILRQTGTYVVVIDNEQIAHRLKVEVGKGQDEWVSVRSDNLQAGDKVAIRGAERLIEGQLVTVNG